MIDRILNFLNSFPPVVAAALISAAVAIGTSVATLTLVAPLRYLLDKRSVRHRLETEYEYEQRKRLRELIGRYRGQMLEVAETFNHRMFNLYANEKQGWLTYDKKPRYYFLSMVFRFLSLCSLARRFQAEAVFIDPRIADKTDLEFLKY